MIWLRAQVLSNSWKVHVHPGLTEVWHLGSLSSWWRITSFWRMVITTDRYNPSKCSSTVVHAQWFSMCGLGPPACSQDPSRDLRSKPQIFIIILSCYLSFPHPYFHKCKWIISDTRWYFIIADQMQKCIWEFSYCLLSQTFKICKNVKECHSRLYFFENVIFHNNVIYVNM